MGRLFSEPYVYWLCVLGLAAFDVAALLFLLVVAKYSKPCTDEEATKCLFTISD